MKYPIALLLGGGMFVNFSALAEGLKITDNNFSVEPSIAMKLPGQPEESPTIIGGTPVEPSSWPATLVFRGPTEDCTSTVIGEKVVLTAAHCVKDRSSATIQIDGVSTKLYCIQHPGYVDDFQLDVALCASKSTIKLPDNAHYEKISTSSKDPTLQRVITLLGYGCRTVGGGDEFGALYRGPATVVKRSGAYISTVGEADGGEAAVCYGDSGGAAYLEPTEHRRVIFGIASRGDIISRTSLTYLGHDEVASFIDEFSKVNGFPVCGLDADASLCHN